MLKYFTSKLYSSSRHNLHRIIGADDFIWALGSLCALNRVPFDAKLLLSQFPLPLSTESMIHGIRHLGFKSKQIQVKCDKLSTMAFPCLALMHPKSANSEEASIALLSDASSEKVILFEAGTNKPVQLSIAEFNERYLGAVILAARNADALSDPDATINQQRSFGFGWFIPELFKYKKTWRDVLLASLVIQLLALGTPLFTQTIIDKVVVHRTESTLLVIAFGLGVFMIFSAILSWVRQYLILHTGNRVDAVLAAGVFDHLFKLPPRYFESRATGVIAARLHGVETIREFIASAAVTLILDLPFLLIFVGIMFITVSC